MKSTQSLIAPQQAALDKAYSSEIAKQKWTNMLNAGSKMYQYYKFQKPMADKLKSDFDAQESQYSNMLIEDPSHPMSNMEKAAVMEARNRSKLLSNLTNPFDLDAIPKIYASMYNPMGVQDIYKPGLDLALANTKGGYDLEGRRISGKYNVAAAREYGDASYDRSLLDNEYKYGSGGTPKAQQGGTDATGQLAILRQQLAALQGTGSGMARYTPIPANPSQFIYSQQE